MTEEERYGLVLAVTRWADAHPARNLPLIAFADGEELSPLDIATEMQEGSDLGEHLIRIFESATAPDPTTERDPLSLDEIIRDLESGTRPEHGEGE